jgi:hypothetical protein
MTENEARHYKIGEFFTLYEFLHSETALQHPDKYEKQFNPPQYVIDNIKNLCHFVLLPLRLKFGPVIIKSGYRCKELNELIGGSKTSQHMKGQAADIIVQPIGKAYKWLAHNVPYDQLINEYDYSWIHVSFAPRNRFQLLKIDKNGTTRIKLNDL